MTTILSISAQNFLSLEDVAIELRPLNVLVGPNGAGKTNILRIFQFLGDVARHDLMPAINDMEGFDNLFFHGKRRAGRRIRIHFSGVISKHASLKAPDEYTLSFWRTNAIDFKSKQRSQAIGRREEILIKRTAGRGRRITLSGGSLKIESVDSSGKDSAKSSLQLQSSASGLATIRRLGEAYEASGVEALAQVFEQLRLFDINVDAVRRPSSRIDNEVLKSDASNLSSYLLRLHEEKPDVFQQVCEDVRHVLPGFIGFHFVPVGGSEEAVALHVIEDKLSTPTPLSRISFGTIRAIGLFTMLNDPNPPSLTCLEEIDHGIHPHALDRLVDRIREASQRTQIILATHSPALVNRLDASELIIVERDEKTAATRIMRPDENLVRNLRAETGYGLGELWFSGSIGGGLYD
jgi:predicted ATPase